MLRAKSPRESRIVGNPPVRFDEGEGSFIGPSLLYIGRGEAMDRARLGAAMSLTMISPELSSILTGPRHCSAPDWFKELQAKAWGEFEAEPFPARTNELWRFS